ncbi:MAG: hypothetical protein R3360_09000, partial [Alphaproteobacteria bacterium]|nr:hypothetical protein [Alphaproteobacteria bacterium]
KRSGDTLTFWKGERVQVHEVPGHDRGQLALAPQSLRWFLAGDLIQSFGTILIAEPEGDMAAYFQTLERIIDLAPAVVIPSHGMPMRGIHSLQETLAHRREREGAILTLAREGKTVEETLKIIYHDVDPRLHPYALKTLQAHLMKLRNEGRLN